MKSAIISFLAAFVLQTTNAFTSLRSRRSSQLCSHDKRCKVISQAIDDESSSATDGGRRLFLTTTCTGVAAAMLTIPSPAFAAKGAAEYDFEFYIRDLVLGNRPEGNLPASNAPPVPPPRTLKQPLLGLLLDDEFASCIPVQELVKLSGAPITEIASRVKAFRTKVEPAFSSRYPWKDCTVSDEYYFDCSIYSVWKIAAFYIENYEKRDEWVRNIGRRILNELASKELISKESIAILNTKGPRLTDTILCVNEILSLFQQQGFCSGFRLGEKNDEMRSGLQVFDELDNQEIADGGSVNALVSVFNPATLGASLQITGEGSRFVPDLIGPTLAAVWEKLGAGGSHQRIEVGWESYFVDPVYRPNPKDFFPDERLYQYTIASKKI